MSSTKMVVLIVAILALVTIVLLLRHRIRTLALKAFGVGLTLEASDDRPSDTHKNTEIDSNTILKSTIEVSGDATARVRKNKIKGSSIVVHDPSEK